ncbi:MAG: aminotransferase class III-fold pyridoxal phosphate-dependent enzyme [Candidatus Nitrosocaldaceae archaeon]
MRIDIRVEPPGSNARKIVSIIDNLCAKSTFTYPLVIHDGEGCYIRDVDDNIYLDFTSNICSTPLGYSHQAVISVLKEYSNNGAHKIAGQDFYSIEHAKLAEKILSIVPNNFKVFFINSGAEAVENAIKVAYRYTKKSVGLSCIGAFHGRTLGALTFTYSKQVHKKDYPELPVKRIRFNSVEELDELKDLSNISFIIIEVIQGESGYNIASKPFIDKIHKISKEQGIPLIVDEVQSGMGRTGRWWAYQHYDIEPDIMSVAKGLQVGATLYNKRFDPEAGAISSTWGGGHRIDMAIGAAIIDTIEREHLLDNARDMGAILLKRFKEIKDRFDVIVDVRGIGLMIGLEFVTSKIRDDIIHNSFKRGLLLLPGGSKAIRIAPPLIIGKDEIDEGLYVFEDVLKRSILSS